LQSSSSDAVSRSQGLSLSGKLPGQREKPDVISVRFVPPRALSPEEVTVISERCDQRFIKLHVSRILDDEVFCPLFLFLFLVWYIMACS